jgi:leucine-zipper of insertion element IS481
MAAHGCPFTGATRSRCGYSSRDAASEAARQAAVSRQTVSKWVARYRAEDRAGCETARRDPIGSPLGYPSGSFTRSSGCVGSARVPPDRLDAAPRTFHGLPDPLPARARTAPASWNFGPIPNRYEWPHPVTCCTWTPRGSAAFDRSKKGRATQAGMDLPPRGGGRSQPVGLRGGAHRIVRTSGHDDRAGATSDRLLRNPRRADPQAAHTRDAAPITSLPRRGAEVQIRNLRTAPTRRGPTSGRSSTSAITSVHTAA